MVPGLTEEIKKTLHEATQETKKKPTKAGSGRTGQVRKGKGQFWKFYLSLLMKL